MRRGLMAWDPEELPMALLRQRARRLQDAMAAAGLDATILYTNFVRSGAVSYLTGFSPYWADGLLLVPRQGELVFATTLSTRVGSWIQSVKPVGELVNSPTPGAVLGRRLASGGGMRRLGILECDAFPAGLYDELAAALPGIEIVECSDVFAIARGVLDDSERTLLAKADAMARESLDHADAANIGSAVGAVEKHARLCGAEEVYVAIAPDLDADRRFLRLSGGGVLGRTFAIRATVAYKGVWTRRVKTYARDDAAQAAIRRADAWFASFSAGIDVMQPLKAQLIAAVARLPGARLTGWLGEAPVGTHPLATIASSERADAAPARVSAIVLTLGLIVDGVPWCGGGLAGFSENAA